MRQKAMTMTEKKMKIGYSSVLRNHSYADHEQQHVLLDQLGLDVDNAHQGKTSAGNIVDSTYEVFSEEVSRHIKTKNPVTGKPRHLHVSMDKFTEAKIQRQAVNLRMLDSDGSPVLVHATTGVIKTYPDPVPEYTATQASSTTHGRHEADGRGVTSHVAECLREDFGLTDADIGRQVSSSSSDCEAVYSGKSNGFCRIWTEKFGRPLVHLDDRDHRLETMLDKISKEDEGSWLSDYLDKLKQVIGVFQNSAMLKRQLRKAAEQLEQVAVALQRLIETHFVEYMVDAVSRVLQNRAAMVNVLHELLALGSIFSAGAHDALKTLESPAFIMSSLTTIDVMTPAVTMSKCGQKDIYTIFEDRRTVNTYLDAIDRMATGAFRGVVGVSFCFCVCLLGF